MQTLFDDYDGKLEILAKKVYSNIGKALHDLDLEKGDTVDLSTLVFGSMNIGNRYDSLTEIVRRITQVATRFNDSGVFLRFINYSQDEKLDGFYNGMAVDKTMKIVKPRGTTKIGTVLRNKIVNPILQKPRTGNLKAPVLVVIITDGENAILLCKKTLGDKNAKGKPAVAFQISYVGESEEAEQYVRQLSTDPDVQGMNPHDLLQNPATR
ncbi:hypothetical protein K440DRAFT_636550 [Wilcoxina mikolae CBS 423.85]|nr:hypothetical protein K440DRAFT_636550 [Wilcoxina mikolae CBS 423.85]